MKCGNVTELVDPQLRNLAQLANKSATLHPYQIKWTEFLLMPNIPRTRGFSLGAVTSYDRT